MPKRENYKELQWWVLECYIEFCRRKIENSEKWSENETELGYAAHMFEDFDGLPIEVLMIETTILLLGAGKESERKHDEYHRNKIQRILGKHSLGDLLGGLCSDERDEFYQDLVILGLVQKIEE